uniref:Uncharacterized protein n=1 Tax=Aphanomyces astaci TaxID=112090 RepID=A0A1I9Q6C2_APHAT|nr:hypothetical protein [Aphanomyces astaci]AOQ30610.1 hypothetical protein [Aphanomyces astaci]
MQILKKNILNITNNNFDNYQIYLKNLNFLNKLKKKNKIFLKDTFLLKLKEFYLLNLNLKENYFFENLNLNLDHKKKENLLYTITNINNKKDILINLNIINYFTLNLYTYLLFNKIKKYKIKKFIINNKEICYKKSKNLFPYLKGRIIKFKKSKKKINKKNKKYFLINFFSLIKKIKFDYLFKKKDISLIKNPFLRRRYKKKMRLRNIFKKLKKKKKYFKIKNNKKENSLLKFNFSRKHFVFDFNKKQNIYNLKKNYELYNKKNFLNYFKIIIKK